MGSKTPEAMILYHESKHNILAFVSKANRAHNVAHQKIDGDKHEAPYMHI